MKSKVIVAGHVCLDITPVFPNSTNGHIDQIMLPGKLIQMEPATVSTGGAVANTGLAMKFFGTDVKLLGKIGNDNFGNTVSNIFNTYDAGDGLIIDDQVTTSYSVVIAAPGSDRIFLHHPGANDTFISADIEEEELQDVVLFHFGYPSIMSSMYHNDGTELVALYKRVKKKGIITSLDLAAVDENSEAGKLPWDAILEKVLPYVDVFVPSVEEICYMIAPDMYHQWVDRAGGRDITEIISLEEVDALGERLIGMGANIVLIKCGAPGLYYITSNEKAMDQTLKDQLDNVATWSNRKGFEPSYKPECVLSATGAGDTTIAAFLTAMIRQKSLDMCLKLATATGASNVTAYDALSGLKTLEELEVKISKGWEKNSTYLNKFIIRKM